MFNQFKTNPENLWFYKLLEALVKSEKIERIINITKSIFSRPD